MNAEIVMRMREEEADLVRKLQAVRDFLAVYGGASKVAGKAAVASTPKTDSSGRAKVEIDSFTAQTRTSVVLSLQALTTSTGLMKTSELVQFVEAMGHTINGDNKVNALGALLARSADVIGHGKSGWELADREKALRIVSNYAPKRNEAPASNAGGASEADGEGVSPPQPSPVIPQPWHRA